MNSTLTRTKSFLRIAATAIAVAASAALAQLSNVSYIGANGQTQTASNVTEIDPWNVSDIDNLNGWYLVRGTLERTGALTVLGTAHIILEDGSSLTVAGGDREAGINVSEGNSLAIYAQSTGSNMGKLTAKGGIGGTDIGSSGGAGIGGNGGISCTSETREDGGDGSNSGNITINGGAITAIGGNNTGIGGGKGNNGYIGECYGIVGNGGNGGSIIINGGTIKATGGIGGGTGGNGIGVNDIGGNGGNSGNIIINGGTITATGGIGGGTGGNGVKGVGGSTIGTSGSTGANGGNGGNSGNITINGGTITSTGGIGGGLGGTGGAGGKGGPSAGYGGEDGGPGGTGGIGGTGGNGGIIAINGGIITSAIIGGGLGGSGGAGGAGGNRTIANGGSPGREGVAGSNGSNGAAGTFALSGNSVVFADSVGDGNKSGRTNGILFVGKFGEFYGESVTLPANLSIPASYSLAIPSNATLNIPANITLSIASSAMLKNNGVINNCGKITGTVTENQPVENCSELEDPDDPSPILHQIASDGNSFAQTRNGVSIAAKTGATVKVYSLSGKLERAFAFGSGAHNVSLGDLPKGVYIVRLSFGSEKRTLNISVM